MKQIVWTRSWHIKPKRYYFFRITTRLYVCHYTLWHWALIEEIDNEC